MNQRDDILLSLDGNDILVIRGGQLIVGTLKKNGITTPELVLTVVQSQ